jgi:hypothetical protein
MYSWTKLLFVKQDTQSRDYYVPMFIQLLKHLNTVNAREHNNTFRAFFKLSTCTSPLNYLCFSCLFHYLWSKTVLSISYIYKFANLYGLSISFYILSINHLKNKLLWFNLTAKLQNCNSLYSIRQRYPFLLIYFVITNLTSFNLIISGQNKTRLFFSKAKILKGAFSAFV